METLLETLSKLKESGVILSDYTRLSTKEMFVQPIAINRLIRRLGDISGKPVAGIDVNKLYGKVTAAVKGKNKTIEFSHKEARCFPVLLSMAKDNNEDIRFLLDHIDFQKSASFRRAVNAYFNIYADNNMAVSSLGKKIRSALAKNHDLIHAVPYLRGHENFLSEKGPYYLADYITEGVLAFFKDNPLFPNFFPWTLFTKKSIILASIKNSQNDTQEMNLFREIAHTDSYKNLVPRLAENAIFAVDKGNDIHYRNELLFELNKAMGDPRDDNQAYHWADVNPKAVEIYLYWRKRTDLDLFFNIISQTTVRDVSADKMWIYRKRFWEKYLRDMKYTRVVLGPEAEKIANRLYRSKIPSYARLERCSPLQSLFLCSIGNYVFLEVSHNGSVRVYRMGEAPVPFFEKAGYRRTYSYTDVTQANYVYKKAHLHSETDSWQSALRRWIFEHCRANGMY